MQYILVLYLSSLAVTKMILQTSFGKKNVRNSADALCFNALIFLFSGILFAYEIVGCPWQVWVYATFAAAFSMIFQMTYTKALSIGNVSLTALVVNLSMVVNVLVSYIFYHESLSLLRIIGILLTIVTLVLGLKMDKGSSKGQKMWMFLVIIAMLSSSAVSIVQKMITESEFVAYKQGYTSASYIVAAVLAYLTYWMLKRKGEDKTFKMGKPALFYAMAIGVVLGVFVVSNLYALSVVESTFLFPAYSGGVIVLSAIAGVIFFKDKLNLRQIIGVIVGVVAIVLMNF